MASNTVKILVATMTGNAELAAEEMAEVLSARGYEADVVMMDGLDASVFDDDAMFVIATSTYGQGDVPDNGRTLYQELVESKPDLGRVAYGVFGLGDRTYADTFGDGGRRFDEALAACGARRIGERHLHDAASGELPEDEAAVWAQGWADLLEAVAEAA